MSSSDNILVVIPARGGSKGIPRKNVRNLGGKPLIYYSINNALNIKGNVDVYVSSDDDEILTLSKNFGAQIHKRDPKLAEDVTTLDPVIYSCFMFAMKEHRKTYKYIITLQPTSPLLKTSSLEGAIQYMDTHPSIETTLSAVNDTHLTWRKEDNGFKPNYKVRLNRQYLDPVYKETGGFFITRSTIITENNRIGEQVHLYELDEGENIDIDNFHDWALCEYILKKKRVLIVVRGNLEIGLGHVMNTLSIANDILEHEVIFYCMEDSKLAYEMINKHNYQVHLQSDGEFIQEILELKPDIVINDILDTDELYISKLKSSNLRVINIEDQGRGAKLADIVINAMYEKRDSHDNQYFGFEYFILKQEFLHSSDYKLRPHVENVLITFGGVDPCNLTKKVLEAIYEHAVQHHINITVVAGMGYKDYASIEGFKKINIEHNVKNISEYMMKADLAFCSGGRTTFELAAIGVPTIVLCQNERELTHGFCKNNNGFINLGLGYEIPLDEIKKVYINLINNLQLRKEMNERYSLFDLKHGKDKVMRLIKSDK